MEHNLVKYSLSANSVEDSKEKETSMIIEDSNKTNEPELTNLQKVLKEFFAIPIEQSGISSFYNLLVGPDQQLTVLQYGSENLIALRDYLKRSKLICYHETERIDHENLILSIPGSRVGTSSLKTSISKLNIIIDKRGDQFIESLSFFQNMYENLLYGGYYIIENINSASVHKWINIIQEFKAYEGSEYYLVPIPSNKVSLCNNIFVLHKIPNQ